MAEHPSIRGTGLTHASTRPFKPYVYKGGDIEPPAVIAARERYRAHDAELDAMARNREALAAGQSATCAGEAMPDVAPGYEWYRELADGDELTETAAARDRYQAAMPEPAPLPEPPPVTPASRCGRCGYLTTAAGHRVMCGD
jgi:hypothetical protein